MNISLFKFCFYLILSFLFIAISFRQYRETKSVKRTVSSLLWDFSGLRLIISKIWPDKKLSVSPASTFLLWFVGIYVAFFTVASQRYENRLQIIEDNANSIIAQLSTSAKNITLNRIPRVQSMSIPYKPEILIPHSIFQSLFFDVYGHKETIDLLKEIVVSFKDSLEEVNLEYSIDGERYIYLCRDCDEVTRRLYMRDGSHTVEVKAITDIGIEKTESVSFTVVS